MATEETIIYFFLGITFVLLTLLSQNLIWDNNLDQSKYQKDLDSRRQKNLLIFKTYEKDTEFFNKLPFLSKMGMLLQLLLTATVIVCLLLFVFSF